jgi:hypothetical protein
MAFITALRTPGQQHPAIGIPKLPSVPHGEEARSAVSNHARLVTSSIEALASQAPQ